MNKEKEVDESWKESAEVDKDKIWNLEESIEKEKKNFLDVEIRCKHHRKEEMQREKQREILKKDNLLSELERCLGVLVHLEHTSPTLCIVRNAELNEQFACIKSMRKKQFDARFQEENEKCQQELKERTLKLQQKQQQERQEEIHLQQQQQQQQQHQQIIRRSIMN